ALVPRVERGKHPLALVMRQQVRLARRDRDDAPALSGEDDLIQALRLEQLPGLARHRRKDRADSLRLRAANGRGDGRALLGLDQLLARDDHGGGLRRAVDQRRRLARRFGFAVIDRLGWPFGLRALRLRGEVPLRRGRVVERRSARRRTLRREGLRLGGGANLVAFGLPCVASWRSSGLGIL